MITKCVYVEKASVKAKESHNKINLNINLIYNFIIKVCAF